MKRSELILKSFLGAAGTVIYITLLAVLGNKTQGLFGNEPNFLIPIFMITLFVVSACLTGFMVLGKPIRMYLDGLKKEAVIMFGATVAWLALFLLIIGTLLIIFR